MSDRHYKVEFAFTPYPLQREVIKYLDGVYLNPYGEPYRFIIPILGRQSGKSWLARYTILDRAINRGQNCMWVSPTISAARTHWNKLVRLIKKSKIPYERLSQSAKEIHFYGGGIISIRSAIEPDNLRGDSLDFLIMDEAAFYRNGEYVWLQVLMPQITATGGSVLIPTTPNGRNWVYGLFKQGQDPKSRYFKSWQIPSTSSPYQDLELLENIRQTVPSKVWREEYLAEFLSDGGGVFSGVEEAARGEILPAPIKGHEYVMGIDFGWSNNPSALTVVDKFERKQVFGTRFVNIGTIRTIKTILEQLDYWQPSLTMIEANGIGKPLLGLLKEVLSGRDGEDLLTIINERIEDDPDEKPLNEIVGGHRIRAITTDNDTKCRLIERLAADIEWGRLELLGDATEYGDIQMSEMSTFERKRTQTGKATYAAAEGSEDDTISALATAYEGVPKPKKWRLPQKEQKDEKGKSPFRSGNSKIRKYRSRE